MRIRWKNSWKLIPLIMLAVVAMAAVQMPRTSDQRKATSPIPHHAVTAVAPTGPTMEVTGQHTELKTHLTTLDLRVKYDSRGVITDCGPCPPGVRVGGSVVQLAQTLHVHNSGTPSSGGRTLFSTTFKQGLGFFCPFKCTTTIVYSKNMDVGWYLGAVHIYGAAEYLNGCGAFACYVRGKTVTTPHGHNPQLHYNTCSGTLCRSVTYEDNYHIQVLSPSGDTGGQYIDHWPWGWMIVHGDGTYQWDTDNDCYSPLCY